MQRIQWNLSNPDTNGAEESVIVSEVSSFQRLSKSGIYLLGVGKVSCLERCPRRECPHREREVERGSTVSAVVMVSVVCMLCRQDCSLDRKLSMFTSVDGLIRY